MIHICNNFVASKVHVRLVAAIARACCAQTVVVPVRRVSDLDRNRVDLVGVEWFYFLFENRFIRYFPILKILRIFVGMLPVLRRTSNLESADGHVVECIAHNFWSDGAPIFIYSFLAPVRYVLVVRNTDINIFVRRLKHYHFIMRWMIERSSGVIFVSAAHLRRFRTDYPDLLAHCRNVKLIPNGIDDYWHVNVPSNKAWREPIACFVGRFDQNKNLRRILAVAREVAVRIPDFKLRMAGGTLEELRAAIGPETVPPCVETLGFIEDQEQLGRLYRSARVFVMPSMAETFGLVYLEALSQGCSVICSRGEGIDGYFDHEMVVSVDPTSVIEIRDALLRLIEENAKGIDSAWIRGNLGDFRWDVVAAKYLEVLRSERHQDESPL